MRIGFPGYNLFPPPRGSSFESRRSIQDFDNLFDLAFDQGDFPLKAFRCRIHLGLAHARAQFLFRSFQGVPLFVEQVHDLEDDIEIRSRILALVSPDTFGAQLRELGFPSNARRAVPRPCTR